MVVLKLGDYVEGGVVRYSIVGVFSDTFDLRNSEERTLFLSASMTK